MNLDQVDVAVSPPSATPRRSSWRPRLRSIALASFVLAAVPRLVTAFADFRTTDEWTWMLVSRGFGDAVRSCDLSSATAGGNEFATLPGVTTMWIGASADWIWRLGHGAGLLRDPDDAVFSGGFSMLDLAQVIMALVTAALVALIVVLVARWAGRAAGAVAGALLATEPFLVAHGAVLHTDELVALFGLASVLATALALGLPRRTTWAGRRRSGALGGALFGAACLTKVTALMFAPGLAALWLWALAVSWRPRAEDAAVAPIDAALDEPAASDPPEGGRPGSSGTDAVIRIGAAWVVAGAVVFVAAYPALWVGPIHELGMIKRSAQMGTTGHPQFFRGRVTLTPGPAFYPVALVLRMTPWFLGASVVAAIAVFARSQTRRFGAVVLCTAVPVLVALSAAAKQFDRYGIALLASAALLVGLVLGAGVRGVDRSRQRHVRVAGAVATALIGTYSVVVAPWGLAYFNPALGGASRAERTVLVGWNEGYEQAGRLIARREAGRCEVVTITGPPLQDVFPCGRLVPLSEDPTYVVLYISSRQRMTAGQVAELTRGRDVVGRIEELDVTYAEVYGPRGR